MWFSLTPAGLPAGDLMHHLSSTFRSRRNGSPIRTAPAGDHHPQRPIGADPHSHHRVAENLWVVVEHDVALNCRSSAAAPPDERDRGAGDTVQPADQRCCSTPGRPGNQQGRVRRTISPARPGTLGQLVPQPHCAPGRRPSNQHDPEQYGPFVIIQHRDAGCRLSQLTRESARRCSHRPVAHHRSPPGSTRSESRAGHSAPKRRRRPVTRLSPQAGHSLRWPRPDRPPPNRLPHWYHCPRATGATT